MFYASPFALSMKPKNSIHKTQILVRVFIGTFSFWPFFFGFLASRIHLLGRGDEKKTKQREKKTNMSFYIRP